MKFCTLVSGSSGNSTYISGENINILVDVGLSAKRIKYALETINVNIDKIDAILITHEHKDHIMGAEVISRQNKIPVFLTRGTYSGMKQSMKAIDEEYVNIIEDNKKFKIKNMEITPFSIPHDAVEPVGYSIITEDKKVTISTDLGFMPETVFENIKDSDIVLLESNYDEEMLRNGPYPIYLKRRIESEIGHLSNIDAGETIGRIVNYRREHNIDTIPKILLGHISYNNNLPRLVLETIYKELHNIKINPINDTNLYIADRFFASEILEI